MMKNDMTFEDYNFDKIYDRAASDSIKYSNLPSDRKGRTVIPMWVADMDFISPNPVKEALKKRADHGIYGYPSLDKECTLAVARWFRDRYDFEISPKWIIQTPGVIFAIANAIRTLTIPGDAVMISRPVYHHFSSVINDLGRKLVNSPLVLVNESHKISSLSFAGASHESDADSLSFADASHESDADSLSFAASSYTIDFDDFEQKIIDNNVKAYILCNPHNPIGRVWTRAELEKIRDICLKHDVFVISDEIHCDFVWIGNSFTSYGTLGQEALDNCIICTAPSKTFNIAGLCCANIIIPNRPIYRKFAAGMNSMGLYVNIMGTEACRAAYSSGLSWLEDVRDYIYENIIFMESYLKENLPCIRMIRPEGTYLVWTDMRDIIPMLMKSIDDASISKVSADSDNANIGSTKISSADSDSAESKNVSGTSTSGTSTSGTSISGASTSGTSISGASGAGTDACSRLNDFIKNDCGLLLDDGAKFGPEGAGFQRFNIACPRPILKEALCRLRDALV